MKRFYWAIFAASLVLTTMFAWAQKKGVLRASPPDTVRNTTQEGVDITIDYGQPSIKGRTIGKQIAPFNGKPWRTGANEQTTIMVNKDVSIEGHNLAAGKYSIWTVPGEKEWVVIINKNTSNFGNKYPKGSDAFRFTILPQKSPAFAEAMKFSVEKSGMVSFVWGDILIGFVVKSATM